jgi:2-(1,2-epoxy-1,2-dihydrophenyl)acetyl-CoA isomerase
MDKPPKNQIWLEIQTLCTAAEITRATTHEETMQFKHVTLDFDGPVAILKLDHQEVMNAVSMDMLGGLGEALDAIDDKRPRCAASS